MFLSSKSVSKGSDALPCNGVHTEQTASMDRALADSSSSVPAESVAVEQGLPMLPSVALLPAEVAGDLAEVELDLDLDLEFNVDGTHLKDVHAPQHPLPPPSSAHAHGLSLALHESPVANPEGHHLVHDPLNQTLSAEFVGQLTPSRVLLFSPDPEERMYLRARLALAQWVFVDEASSTEEALHAMNTARHGLGFFNLDNPTLDARSLAERFRQTNSNALLVATKVSHELPGWALAARWQRWLLRRRLLKTGFTDLLDKPLEPKKLVSLLNKLVLNQMV